MYTESTSLKLGPDGYYSPAKIYRLAGMNAGERSPSKLNVNKLPAVTGHPEELFRRAGYYCEESTGAIHLLGIALGKYQLDTRHANYVPVV